MTGSATQRGPAPTAPDGVADWAAVFPEVTDPVQRADLLRRIDAVELDDLAGGVPDPSGQAGPTTRPDPVLFGPVLAGLVGDLLADAERRLRRVGLLADPDAVLRSVEEHVVQVTGSLVARALVRRLHARHLAGTLAGATPEERFAAFVAETAAAPGLAAFLAERPELVAWTRSVVSRRLTAVVDVLVASDEAWPALGAAVRGTSPTDRVVAVDLGAGDTHGHGRSVVVLHLDSGSAVVVKPRHLGVEQAFGAVAAWLGEQVGVEVPVLSGWSGGGHGWVEHVGPGTAPPAPGALRATGVLLSALHLLDATDVHYENLLLDRQGLPVVVDAEALLSPRVVGTDRPAGGLSGVVATGLLSLRHDRAGQLDPGALGYTPGALSPFRSWQVVRPGRDDMRLEMASVRVDHPGPMTGIPRRSADREQLAGGFADVLGWVLAHRERVVARVAAAFPEDRVCTVRHIQRPTMLYAQVLRTATHPDFITRADRRRALGRLAVLAPRTPWPLVCSEVRQLDAGDLPAFRVPVHGTAVLDARGRDTGARCDRPPLARCLDAVGRLDDEDAARETAAVHSSLSAWTADPGGVDRP